MSTTKQECFTKLVALIAANKDSFGLESPLKANPESNVFTRPIRRLEVLEIYKKRFQSSLNPLKKTHASWIGIEGVVVRLESNQCDEVVIHDFKTTEGQAVAFTNSTITELIGVIRNAGNTGGATQIFQSRPPGAIGPWKSVNPIPYISQ